MAGRKGCLRIGFAAAVLAACVSMTTLADGGGWSEENGKWTYRSSSGEMLTNAWKKTGNSYYYLDDNGQMAVSALVEYGGDKYYVDESGARVASRWISFPNDGLWDEEVPAVYYYFDSTGRACRDTRKKIDGKIYFFDEEGRMLSGWHSAESNGKEEKYYLGNWDEGWAYTGWQWLVPEEEEDSAGGETKWYYFSLNNGKAVRGKRYINGSYYLFDEETAAMADRWVQGTPGASDVAGIATKSNAWYEPEDGSLKTGWVYAHDPSDTDEQGEQYWFYLDKNGVAFNEGGKDSRAEEQIYSDSSKKHVYMGNGLGGVNGTEQFLRMAAKEIDGKTYLFDENGHMMTGFYYLWVVRKAGSSKPLGYGIKIEDRWVYGGGYYFIEEEGSPREGQMFTGRIKLEETEDYYHFAGDGKAYERMIVNGCLYMEGGIRENAEDGNKYKIVTITSNPDLPVTEKGNNRQHLDCRMIVDANGRVKKNGTFTFDGYRYTVKNYEIVEETAASE